MLDLLGEGLDLRAFLLVGGCDHQCQQVAQRVHGDLDLAALFLRLSPSQPARPALLRAAWKRAPLQDRRRRARGALHAQAQQLWQVVGQRLKAVGLHPAFTLLLDGLARAQSRRAAGTTDNPVTIQRTASNTSRKAWTRCPGIFSDQGQV